MLKLPKITYCIFFLFLFLNSNSLEVKAQSSISSKFPIIVINTNGAEIQDDKNIARMGIIDNGPGKINTSEDVFNDFDGFVGIERRGSSSQMFPKKSYGFAIWTAEGIDSVASILGMPVEEDWILYAPYTDKSLMRNVLAFKIANEMGRYASRTRFCEVMLNGSYQGIYVMMEKVKRDKNRVALNKLKIDENEGENLTGGYIIKIDKTTGSNSNEGWYSPFHPLRSGEETRVYFQYEYPKIKNITQEQREYIKDYIIDFETALSGIDFKDDEKGYRNWADMESFIDFSIVNEISKNIDGYRLSTFMHKDKNGKLIMGPVWDFNLAFGNADYCEGERTSGWGWNFNAICTGDHFQIPFWWERLLQDEQYVEAYVNRWNELRNGILKTSNLLAYIDSVANELNESQIRNYNKWPILGTYVWPNAYVGNTYSDEVNYLKGWIESRTSWLDENINKLSGITSVEDNAGLNNKINLYPNPVEKELYIKYFLEKDETYLIELFDTFGKQLLLSKLEAKSGKQVMTINLQELTKQKLNFGLYFLQLTDENHKKHSFKIILN